MSPRSELAAAALERALREGLGDPGVRVLASEAVGGGCIHQALRLETTAGPFFAKWSLDAPPDVFLREADGLRALASAGSEVAVPRVLAATAITSEKPGLILMEHLERKRSGADDDEALGRGLAAIHRCTAAAFGFPADTYCGTTRQENAWCKSWPEFYAERRLRPLLERTLSERGLSAADRSVFDRLIGRLPTILGEAGAPSLIHGDLWSGNVMATVRGPALFDPACAYADREMEFGITTLFGGFSSRFWDAYEEAWPLPRGWKERNPLYQAYHLLNHYLLFGGHYGSAALSAARRYV
jgi:protein-ribulosamine 3-kinase